VVFSNLGYGPVANGAPGKYTNGGTQASQHGNAFSEHKKINVEIGANDFPMSSACYPKAGLQS
jgi:hypothetical protein